MSVLWHRVIMNQMLTSFDLHLLGEGTHFQAFNKLGAHVIEHDGVSGVHFAVWAPNARASAWSATSTAGTAACIRCARSTESGYWEIFVPDLGAGRSLQVRSPRRRRPHAS